MIVPINLERLSGDGYKMNANSPLVTPPSYITHAQLRYTPFTSVEAIQGTFVTGAYSTVEFNITGANLTRYLKLYTSTDGSTYNEVKSWGGTDGIRQKEYLVYSALLNQTGTSAPVATVLENTTGQTLTWQYDDVGAYIALGTFGLTKTFVIISQGSIFASNGIGASAYNNGGIELDIKTFEVSLGGGTPQNNALSNAALEIRIYP